MSSTVTGGGRGDADPSNVLVPVEQGESTFEVRPLAELRADRNVLAVTYDRRPGEWYADYVAATGSRPARLSAVVVGDSTRSAGVPDGAVDAESKLSVTAVESPSDTGRLCQRVDEVLDAWAGDSTVLYFDSLTALLRHVDPLEATRMLHLLTWRVERADATAFYRFDRGTHDERVMARLAPLFDEERPPASGGALSAGQRNF